METAWWICSLSPPAARTWLQKIEQTSSCEAWGGGSFQVEGSLEPISDSGRMGFDAAWFDWKGDGTQDAYVVNDMGSVYGGNVLRENNEGTLDSSGESCNCEVVQDGMGVDVGDYNADGVADLFLVAASKNLLLQGVADGDFIDVTASTGADSVAAGGVMGWGGIFLDHDNDGDMDLLVTQAPRSQHDLPGPIDLMSWEDGGFANLRESLGLNIYGIFRSLVAVDLNQDGILDLLVTQANDRPLLYLSQGCTEQSWLEVSAPVGSRVRVEAGGITRTAWISTESSCGAARPPSRHFGLGSAEEVDAVEVQLSDGSTHLAEGPFCPRRSLEFEP